MYYGRDVWNEKHSLQTKPFLHIEETSGNLIENEETLMELLVSECLLRTKT